MTRYEFVGILALLILIVVLPVYALLEPYRLEDARLQQTRRYVVDGTGVYLENCVECHGPAGQGVGVMPALNKLGASGANHDLLFDTIARSTHGSAMAAWHLDEGGTLTDYQVEGVVTFILNADWGYVRDLAIEQEPLEPTPAPAEVELAEMDIADEMNPHECRACHDEPSVHAEVFGLNCSRCHTLDAWEPAFLLRHTFLLDHGGDGEVACQTCHTENYAANTCYECHDHQPDEMQEVHEAEGLVEYADCAACHPTGVEGEGEIYRDSYQSQPPIDASLYREIPPLAQSDGGRRGARSSYSNVRPVRSFAPQRTLGGNAAGVNEVGHTWAEGQ
jgi:mono/diheme cytochrome c family protein